MADFIQQVVSGLATVLVLWAFFRFTTLGLVMRAVANSQEASRLMGVRVGWIWGGETKALDSPFPNRSWEIGGVAISVQDVGTLGVCLLTVLILWGFFRFTTIGLAMRASAVNPGASRLLGVRVGWMLAIGWGLAAVLGAVAGMMAAPTVFLDPSMMLIILIYAFAAAVLGGIDSPIGAVVGGLLLGVIVNVLGAYVVPAELRLPTALAILLLVLIIRPQGLFGHLAVRRV